MVHGFIFVSQPLFRAPWNSPDTQGAVDMSKHALKHANRPELRQIAKEMIASQEKEIAQLKEWRKEWYAK